MLTLADIIWLLTGFTCQDFNSKYIHCLALQTRIWLGHDIKNYLRRFVQENSFNAKKVTFSFLWKIIWDKKKKLKIRGSSKGAHSIVLFLIVGRRIFPKQNKWHQHQVQYLVSKNFLIDNFHVSSIRSVTPPLSGINSWANPCFDILRIRCCLNFWIFEVISTIYYTEWKDFFIKWPFFIISTMVNE